MAKPKKPHSNIKNDLHFEYSFGRGINFRKRIITISGGIDDKEFRKIDAAMNEFEAKNTQSITIKINSSGGTPYDALAIVGRLRQSKCKIITEGYGCIMSAATIVLASGDHRRISKYAWFMTHEAQYEINGKHSENASLVAQYEREETYWAKWMAAFSKKDQKFWRNAGKQSDEYFTAEQLLELGVVDELF